MDINLGVRKQDGKKRCVGEMGNSEEYANHWQRTWGKTGLFLRETPDEGELILLKREHTERNVERKEKGKKRSSESRLGRES